MSDSDRFDRDRLEEMNTAEWGQPEEEDESTPDERAARQESLSAIEEHMRRIRQAIRKNDDFLLGALRKAGVIQ
jgi:flagellar biosynthesis/type III secretory pathway chaperone